jgi:CRISPR-associated endonuclease/helicase Cas3
MDFTDFFRTATQGLSPFPYQRLIAEDAELPWLLDVPTGAGKTAAAVLGWLWRRRHHHLDGVRQNTPRRLVYCLPMRVLVEQTVEAARGWLSNLNLLAESVADTDKVSVHQLMGGEVSNDWDAWPEAEAILIGTQDQLLSRALNRGYALSRYRWPMHFGLLNSDCLWVMDEVQLMGPGLTTTLQLQALREHLQTDGPACSLWMSATIQPHQMSTVDGPTGSSFAEHALELGPKDLKHPDLAARLSAPKPLVYSGLALSKETKAGSAHSVAEQVVAAHRAGTLTLVIVNQVARAQAVSAELSKAAGDAAAEVVLLHSRFRPPERQALQARLTAELPPAGRIVVATQTVEAGVDISARVLFTELAPWASLVQRFGRCNRRGEWTKADGCQVRWMDLNAETEGAPYEPADLAAARESLSTLTDAGIQSLRQVTDPSAPAPTQVLRKKDLLDLFDTTPDLAGNDVDVSPYIRDADDLDVSLLWRDLSDDEAFGTAPAPEELCPVSLARFRDFLPTLQKRQAWPRVWDGLSEKWTPLRPDALRPGLVLLIDAKGGGYDPALGWWPQAEEVTPVPALPAGQPPNEGYDGDQMTVAGSFAGLRQHLADVGAELETLLGLLPPEGAVLTALRQAAQWHDVGKAHPHFQAHLLQALPPDDRRRTEGPWAKSECPAGGERDTERPHFRHELASALALLEHDGDDLAAYLVASHHGKVRLSLRSLPGERLPGDDRHFARGVWDGDVLPPVTLGDGTDVPETTLSLRLMELGISEAGLSWLERTLALRDRFGPFRLAYLEALLRVADWRASAKERDDHA